MPRAGLKAKETSKEREKRKRKERDARKRREEKEAEEEDERRKKRNVSQKGKPSMFSGRGLRKSDRGGESEEDNERLKVAEGRMQGEGEETSSDEMEGSTNEEQMDGVAGTADDPRLEEQMREDRMANNRREGSNRVGDQEFTRKLANQGKRDAKKAGLAELDRFCVQMGLSHAQLKTLAAESLERTESARGPVTPGESRNKVNRMG